MPGILWLASYPKSGNTWMRAFLANLILDPKTPLPLARISEVCPGDANETWFKPLTDKPVSELGDAEVAALRPRAQKRIVELNKNNVPMKTHSFLGEEHGYPCISMELSVGAIYIVRDPRDVALSAQDHFGLSLDDTIAIMALETAKGLPMPGKNVHEPLTSWSTHVKSWTNVPHRTLHVVRYEDLLADPYLQFGKIARKFGMARDERRIRRAVDHAAFKQLQKQEETTGFSERSQHSQRFFRSGKSGGWREALTPEQVARIERTHREQMRRFGYL